MRKILTFLALLFVGTLAHAASPNIPAPNGKLVRDLTGTVDAATIERLNQRVLAFNDATSVELVALVVPSLNGMAIEDYGHAVIHTWGVGKKDKDNGIVYLWCPAERKQRIEVGYGLEGFMPDVTAFRIIEDVRGRVPRDPPGPRLEAMIEAIIAQLEAAKKIEAAPQLQATAQQPTSKKFYQTKFFWIFIGIVVAVIIVEIFARLLDPDYGDSGGGYSGGGGYYSGGGGGSSFGGFFGGDGGGSSSGGGDSGGGGGGGFSFGGGDGGGGGASGSD